MTFTTNRARDISTFAKQFGHEGDLEHVMNTPVLRAMDDIASWEGPATKWLRSIGPALEKMRETQS